MIPAVISLLIIGYNPYPAPCKALCLVVRFGILKSMTRIEEIRSMAKIDACLQAALHRVSSFIAETTGTAATQEEIADALKRYFVLEEMRAHIEIQRKGALDPDG